MTSYLYCTFKKQTCLSSNKHYEFIFVVVDVNFRGLIENAENLFLKNPILLI